MRLGIWTSYLIDLAPEEMVATFARAGWHELELSDEHSAALLGRGDPEKAGTAFACFAGDHGVSLPQGHLWLSCDIAARDQSPIIDRLREWLDLYLAIGIQAAVLHPGGAERLREGDHPAAIMDARVRTLRALSDHVRGSNLAICLENVRTGGPEVDDLIAIIEATGCAELGICLDTGHLNLASRDQAGFIHRAGGLLKALHIADNEGETDQHLMPYGRGTVDWPVVVSALKEIGYSGLFNLEIPGEIRCPLPVRLAKLDYLKTVMGYMME